jgi:YHS domain-containing protein
MKGGEMFKVNDAGIALLIFVLLFSVTALAASPINTDLNGVAIKGYDPVAYFTMDKPVKGDKNFEYEWKGVKWRFSSSKHMDLFKANPEKYAPRYGGYCAYGVAVNALFDIKPDAWTVHEGKLYLNKDKKVRKIWSKDIPNYISDADKNWPAVLEK